MVASGKQRDAAANTSGNVVDSADHGFGPEDDLANDPVDQVKSLQRFILANVHLPYVASRAEIPACAAEDDGPALGISEAGVQRREKQLAHSQRQGIASCGIGQRQDVDTPGSVDLY